jgi:hypothetical protein
MHPGSRCSTEAYLAMPHTFERRYELDFAGSDRRPKPWLRNSRRQIAKAQDKER